MDAALVDFAQFGEGEASLEKSLWALIELARCPICRKLINEATTINLCTHTFCKRCINQKLEEAKCCPKCNQDLDSSPEEHLLPDDYKNSLATKVRDYFEREKSAKLQAGDTSPTDVSPPGTIAKPDDASVSEETVEESSEYIEDSSKEDDSDRLSSQESSNFAIATEEKNLGKMPKIAGATSSGTISAKDVSGAGKATNMDKKKKKRNKNRKARKFTPDGPSNVQEKASDGSPKGKQKTVDALEEQNEAPSARKPPNQERKIANNIWFSLVPQKNEDGHAFPQLERYNYIRVKDSDMTVSTIQKYLKQKLNLNAETEVDVVCCGQRLTPDQTVMNIQEIWESSIPGGRKAKAKWRIDELVIELNYSKSRDSTASAET